MKETFHPTAHRNNLSANFFPLQMTIASTWKVLYYMQHMWIHLGRLVQYNNLQASEISVVGFLPLTDELLQKQQAPKTGGCVSQTSAD